MKCVLSATIFANLANYHGANQMFIQADMDSNGWPQTGRNKALDVIRRGFGFMYAVSGKIDNKYPKAFQVLDMMGYSKFDPDEKAWNAYYPDGALTTSLKLINSALLTIDRKADD